MCVLASCLRTSNYGHLLVVHNIHVRTYVCMFAYLNVGSLVCTYVLAALGLAIIATC